MNKLPVTTRDGAAKTVDGEAGLSAMDVLRSQGFDEVLAPRGGCCSCATCHVCANARLARVLPPMSADEDDLLSGSDHRTRQSRLSCQIPFVAALDGLIVTIAPED